MYELLRKNKDEAIVLVSVLMFAISLLALPISYFGYQLNKSIEERNEVKWKIDHANYVRAFWHDMEVNELDAFQRTQNLGKAVGEAQVAYLKFIKEFSDLQYAGYSIADIREDLKINGLLISLVGKVQGIKSESSLASIKYDNSLLVYLELAEAMGVKGWKKYASYKSEINNWRNQLSTPYNDALVHIKKTLEADELSSDFGKKVLSITESIRASLYKTGNPTLIAIHELKIANR